MHWCIQAKGACYHGNPEKCTRKTGTAPIGPSVHVLDIILPMLGKIKNPATINRINLVQAIVLSAALAAFDFYSLFINHNNHTGLKTTLLVYVFLLAFFINLADMAAHKRRPLPGVDRRLLLIVTVIAAIGAMNVSLFREFDIMMEYSDWVSKGMPPKPPFFDIFR